MLGRNALLNGLGTALPLLLGLVLLPVVTHSLGPARFGLLGLAWGLIEYFTLFEAGLGRATTKFVAEHLAGERSRIPELVSASLAAQAVLGTIAGGALALSAPFLVAHVLHAPRELAREATLATYAVGLTMPPLLMSLGLRGLLEAAQRFDLATLVKVPSSSSTFVVPAVAAWMGADVPTIILLLFAARLATNAAYVWAIHVALPDLRWRWPRDWAPLRGLLKFGGWLSISNVLNPLFLYFDRYVLSAAAGVAAVGYYNGPFELAFRMLVVPASVTTALLPSLAGALAARATGSARAQYRHALRIVLVTVLPGSALLAVFASDILRLWLGPAFALHAAGALRVLAAGIFVNALAHVPSAALYAAGRPDVNAKFHIGEAIVIVPVSLFLVHRFGVTGAALAYSTRLLLDAILLFEGARRVTGLPGEPTWRWRPLALSAGALAAALALAWWAGTGTPLGLLLGVVGLGAYAGLAWSLLLDGDERDALAVFLRGPFGGGRRQRDGGADEPREDVAEHRRVEESPR